MSMRQNFVRWYLSMELALCLCSGPLNSEAASRFIENLCTSHVRCSDIKCQSYGTGTKAAFCHSVGWIALHHSNCRNI